MEHHTYLRLWLEKKLRKRAFFKSFLNALAHDYLSKTDGELANVIQIDAIWEVQHYCISEFKPAMSLVRSIGPSEL